MHVILQRKEALDVKTIVVAPCWHVRETMEAIMLYDDNVTEDETSSPRQKAIAYEEDVKINLGNNK